MPVDAATHTFQYMKYYPEIDGLRSVAVLSVLIHHLSPDFLPLGYLGVDIFFVISGFVITGSLLSKNYASFGELARNFFERRIRRIAPALIFCAVVGSFFIQYVDPTPGQANHTAFYALLASSNIYLYAQSDNYFAALSELNAFTHTWSLGVEEQFYFIFPILFWFATARNNARTKTYKIPTSWILVGVASIVFYIITAHENPSASFYLSPLRFWEFLAGALLCVAAGGCPPKPGKYSFLAPNVSLFGLITIMALPLDRWQTFATICAVLLTSTIIWWRDLSGFTNRFLSMNWIANTGKASYSIYLWHWPVIVFAKLTFGLTLWSAPAVLLIIFGCSYVSYKWVEQPLRYARWTGDSESNIKLWHPDTCTVRYSRVLRGHSSHTVLTRIRTRT